MIDQNAEAPAPATPDLTTPEGRAQAQATIAMQYPANVPDKFKRADGTIDGDALLASYLHLERKQSGAPDPTPAPAATPAPSEPRGDAPDAEATSLAEALEGPTPPAGADLWALAKQQLMDTGRVDDAVLKGLTEQGVPAEALAAMAAGVASQRKSEMEQAYEAVGGKENFTRTMEWARANLSPAEREAFATALKGPGAIFALQGIASRAATAGAPSGQVTAGMGGIAPNPEASIQPYRSAQDMQNAMADKRYRLDPEYRKQVDRRIMAGAGIDPALTRNI